MSTPPSPPPPSPTRPSPTIRPAVDADADHLFRLAGLLATSAVVQRPAFDASFAVIIADTNQQLLVAERSGRLVGYVHGLVHPAFHANGWVTWVEELHVDEDLRGTGLGRSLMAAIEDWAAATAGVSYHSVATRRAGEFYRALGYSESAAWFKKPAQS